MGWRWRRLEAAARWSRLKARHTLVGVSTRFLFYLTLLYNIVRNRFESEFRW
jgi:atypical dual specificity phosphatase